MEEQQPFWPDIDLGQSVPGTLFHYTTRVGLQGIFGTERLWASSCQFINDASEFSYATALLAEAAKQRATQPVSWIEGQLLTHAMQLHDADYGRGVFVCSFSEDGDLLSQWRAYGRPGDSYSIGFDGPRLAEELRKHQTLLAPCLYKPSEQSAAIEQAMESVLAAARQSGFVPFTGPRMPPGLAHLVTQSALKFIHVCVRLKHPAFAEEREWRLVRVGGRHDVLFRSGRSHLVPYMELPLGMSLYGGMVREVVMGPGPERELDRQALAWFLTNHSNCTDKQIRLSATPYRAW